MQRAGFTLIEIIAVVAIIAILIVILVPRFLGAEDSVRAGRTRTFLEELKAQIDDIELDRGDWPRSTPEPAMDMPNKLNLGSELMVIALYAPGRPDPGLPEERLSNTDGDTARKSLTALPLATLYELADDWGNPIAYIHRADYDQVFEYQTIGADDSSYPQSVRAKKNPVTDDYYNRVGYQLLSAGPDREFGTEDDIANYKAEDQ